MNTVFNIGNFYLIIIRTHTVKLNYVDHKLTRFLVKTSSFSAYLHFQTKEKGQLVSSWLTIITIYFNNLRLIRLSCNWRIFSVVYHTIYSQLKSLQTCVLNTVNGIWLMHFTISNDRHSYCNINSKHLPFSN